MVSCLSKYLALPLSTAVWSMHTEMFKGKQFFLAVLGLSLTETHRSNDTSLSSSYSSPYNTRSGGAHA